MSRFINRCAVKGADGSLGYESCRLACKSCQPTCGAADACSDSTDWSKKNDAARASVEIRPRRASRIKAVPRRASRQHKHQRCSKLLPRRASRSRIQAKTCSWVADLPSTRCVVKDADKIFAYERCRASCGSCGSCEDSATWAKAGSPDKDCSWVSRFVNRCAVVGADGTLGYESCRFACGSCAPEASC